jgi:GH24 family phage-related lysozyme (muramidase)
MGRTIARKKIGKNYMVELVYFRDGYRLYPYRKVRGQWHEGSGEVFGKFNTLEEAKEEYKKVTPNMILTLSVGLRNL